MWKDSNVPDGIPKEPKSSSSYSAVPFGKYEVECTLPQLMGVKVVTMIARLPPFGSKGSVRFSTSSLAWSVTSHGPVLEGRGMVAACPRLMRRRAAVHKMDRAILVVAP